MPAVLDEADAPIAYERTIVVTPEEPTDDTPGEPPQQIAPPRLNLTVELTSPGIGARPPLAVPALELTVGQYPPLLQAGVDSPRMTVAVQAQPPAVPIVTGPADAPPVKVTATLPPPAALLAGTITIPALQLRVRMPPPSNKSAALTLSDPEDGEYVNSFHPQLTVALESADADEVYQIEIQYDSASTFDIEPVNAVIDVPVVDGGAVWTPTTAVYPFTYWRARLLSSGDEVIVGWTEPRAFSVVTEASSVGLAVTWVVDSTAVRPIHLWHFDPPGVEEGDLVTVYGQGFPLSTGSLTLNGEPIAADTWELVEANSTADHATRAIDAYNVDPEHFEVRFIAPPGDDIGGPLTVES